MKLDNIYRGDIIKCEGFTGSEPIVRSDSSGRKFYRYGKFDRIYRSNTVLIKIGDDLYIDLLSASMDVSSNFDNIGLYVMILLLYMLVKVVKTSTTLSFVDYQKKRVQL